MGSNAVSKTLQDAQEILGAELAERVLRFWKVRYRTPTEFLAVLTEFDRCQFWRDDGHRNVWEWGKAQEPKSTIEEWKGWAALEGVPLDDIPDLIFQHQFRPEMVAAAVGYINEDNYRSWITLALNLNEKEFRKAVTAWRRLAYTGYEGQTIFVPLWMPIAEHAKVFGRHDTKRPWEKLCAYFKGTP